jgi:hypothetical protein
LQAVVYPGYFTAEDAKARRLLNLRGLSYKAESGVFTQYSGIHTEPFNVSHYSLCDLCGFSVRKADYASTDIMANEPNPNGITSWNRLSMPP